MPSYKFTSSAESKSIDNDFFVKCRLNHAPISHIERARFEFLIDETSQVLQRISDPGSRDRHSKILDFQRSLLSPIRRLPPDIMGEIFSFIVAGNPIKYGYYGFQNTPTIVDAWNLTWVCTWWRDLALSQPALWSSMKILFLPHHRDTCEEIQFLKECLIPRSGLMPLDLSMELPYCISFPYSFTLESKAVLNVLLDKVERWKHLQLLNFPESSMAQLVAMIISKQAGASSPLPLLQSLTVASPHRNYEFGGIFMHCPSLRKLCIRRLMGIHRDAATNIQNLVDLEIQICANKALVDLLHVCPLLQTLSVGWLVDDSRIIHQELSHIHLTTLNLSCLGPFSATAWMKFIRLPKLAHLNIRAHGGRAITPSENSGVVYVSYASLETTFDTLLEMLLSSGCSLQTATVYNVFNDGKPSSKGCLLRFTDTIVDDFIAKLPVTSTGQRILTKARAGPVDAGLDYC